MREAEAKVLTEEILFARERAGWQHCNWNPREFKREFPPPTAPADFAQELAELRVCVELQRERDELRSELDSRVGEGQETRQLKTRSLAPFPDLVMGDPPSGEVNPF